MADWQTIKSRAMLRDLAEMERRDTPLSSEEERRRHLMRLQQDIDHVITDSLVTNPREDDMDVLRHLVRQNKRLREHGLTLREQVHRKEQIYRRRLMNKRHETRAFEEMIEDLEKANERLKDYYELYKGTGIHLDPEAIRKRSADEPPRIPAYRKSIYDSYARAYPSSKQEAPRKSLSDQVLLRTMTREKGGPGGAGRDETKRMRDKMEVLKLDKDKMMRDISTLGGGKRLPDGRKITLPKGATLSGAKDKLELDPEKLAMLKLFRAKKEKGSDTDDEYSEVDSEDSESSGESDSEDVAEKWKRMKEQKYRKIRKMSDALENIHGESPKEFKDRKKRRQNIEMDRKNRNMGDTTMKVDEITRRLKELEERSAKVIAQKSKIDDLIEKHKHEMADDDS